MKNVLGRLRTPKRRVVAPSASSTGMRRSRASWLRKERTLSPDSWRSTSTTATSGSLRATRSSAGSSWRQGTHHVAQKFTTTTLPRRSDNRVTEPPGAVEAKLGAGAPTRPAAPASSTCAVITATSPAAASGRESGSDGQTRAASDARAIAPMKIAASQRGSAVGDSVLSGAGGRSPPICSPKQRQEVEQLRQLGELARRDDQAHHDHERTAHRVDEPQMRGEDADRAPCHAETARDEQERDAEPERIGQQEDRPGRQVGVQEEVEDEREIRADARREAHAKGDADEEAPPETGRPALEAQVQLPREQWDADEPEHLHPQDHEQQAADALQPDDKFARERSGERDEDPEQCEDE